MNNYRQYFHLGDLISKYLKNELAPDEKTELDLWLKTDERNQELFDKITEEVYAGTQPPTFSAAEKEKAWEQIKKNTGHHKNTTRPARAGQSLIYIAAAASVLLVIGLAVTTYFNKKAEQALHVLAILPGSDNAVLTLTNGSQVVLSDARAGEIGRQQNVEIKQTAKGWITYTAEGPAQTGAAFNTLTTPRGGQYAIILQDGTKVWLNAASTLKYPVVFAGNERQVELSGEAYFEVAKNAEKPFLVKTAGQTVRVLGTHFNVNSYADEKATRTTLLEGKVTVTGNTGGQTLKLRPGEEAITAGSKVQLAAAPDIDGAMAWKEGKFLFNNTDLHTVMRMLSRWYDVDVEYQGPVAEHHYSGRISRNAPVSQVFEILKTSGINFIINGRKIIVKS